MTKIILKTKLFTLFISSWLQSLGSVLMLPIFTKNILCFFWRCFINCSLFTFTKLTGKQTDPCVFLLEMLINCSLFSQSSQANSSMFIKTSFMLILEMLYQLFVFLSFFAQRLQRNGSTPLWFFWKCFINFSLFVSDFLHKVYRETVRPMSFIWRCFVNCFSLVLTFLFST